MKKLLVTIMIGLFFTGCAGYSERGTKGGPHIAPSPCRWTSNGIECDGNRDGTVDLLIKKSDGTVEINGAIASAEGVFNVMGYGAVGDGVTDDASAINAAAAAAEAADGTLFAPAGYEYRVASQLDLRYVRYIDFRSDIEVDFSGSPGVILGDSSQVGDDKFWNIVAIRTPTGNVPSDPLIRIIGLKGGRIHIGESGYVQLYADAGTATDSSIAYNSFYPGTWQKLEFLNESGTSWINENKFFGGRLTTIDFNDANGGTYNHNNNIFYGPTLEDSTITFDIGAYNIFHDARLEGSNTITFDAGTYGNILYESYVSSAHGWLNSTSATVTDNGLNNDVVRRQRLNYEKVPLVHFSASDSYVTLPYGVTNLNESGGTFSANAWQLVYESPYIPILPGAAFQIWLPESGWRNYIECYDAGKALLAGAAPSPSYFASSVATTWDTDGYYKDGANVGGDGLVRRFVLQDSTVKFIKIKLRVGSPAIADISGFWIDFLNPIYSQTHTPTAIACEQSFDPGPIKHPQSITYDDDDNLDQTIGSDLTSEVILVTGDNDSDNDSIDLQDGLQAGQKIKFIGAASIDADDTFTIDVATDSTCTGCSGAGSFAMDDPGDSIEYYWTGAAWIELNQHTVD
jgi:hypothetical protein